MAPTVCNSMTTIHPLQQENSLYTISKTEKIFSISTENEVIITKSYPIIYAKFAPKTLKTVN
jgi:hypothetical protein